MITFQCKVVLDNIMDRIAKKIASYGYCSRRDAEILIFAGRVKINGAIEKNPAIKISDSDIIEIDNKIINSKIQPKIFLYHKPVGVITTARDPQGRTTVLQRIAMDYPHITERLIYVGRLDINSSGLLLLTNTPAVANFLETAKFLRIYKVRISGKLSSEQIEKIKSGIIIDGIKYSGISDIKNIVENDERGKGGHEKNQWIQISLTEGKNREIRKIINNFGLSVSKLVRTNYHNFSLENLQTGKIIEADNKSTTKVLQAMKELSTQKNSLQQ
jgi:23S rRNA pseudouridine2605 synthase